MAASVVVSTVGAARLAVDEAFRYCVTVNVALVWRARWRCLRPDSEVTVHSLGSRPLQRVLCKAMRICSVVTPLGSCEERLDRWVSCTSTVLPALPPGVLVVVVALCAIWAMRVEAFRLVAAVDGIERTDRVR